MNFWKTFKKFSKTHKKLHNKNSLWRNVKNMKNIWIFHSPGRVLPVGVMRGRAAGSIGGRAGCRAFIKAEGRPTLGEGAHFGR